MKLFSILVAGLSLFIFYRSPYLNDKKKQDTYSIEIFIKKLSSEKGQIMLLLQDDNKKVLHKKAVKVEGIPFKTSLENIPAGTYSLKFFHDENENEKMDLNLFGIPKEQYGFSNNANGVMGPPKFEKTLFEVTKDETLYLIAR